MTIRPATEADLGAILDLYNEAILNSTAVYQEKPHTLEMRQQWYADKQTAGFPVFVAEIYGIFAGFSTYGPFRNWPGYRFTVEHSVYVVSTFRRMNIGRRLVEALIEHARNAGMHIMIAGIDSSGEGSIALHRSLGFIEVAHFKEVGYKFGQWLDLKFMQLNL